MEIAELYERHYDLGPFDAEPIVNYMIASIPRSGSTYFLLRLWSTGVFGAPLEYLTTTSNYRLFSRLSDGDWNRYWKRLTECRTTENGVFGTKIFINDYKYFLSQAAGFLKHITPTHVIYFTRRDKVSQAISYARAMHENRWMATDPAIIEPVYDFARIREAEQGIIYQESCWERIFEITGEKPLRIEYEKLLCNEREVMEQISNYFNIPLERQKVISIGEMDRQADLITEEWKIRYSDEKAHNGAL